MCTRMNKNKIEYSLTSFVLTVFLKAALMLHIHEHPFV